MAVITCVSDNVKRYPKVGDLVRWSKYAQKVGDMPASPFLVLEITETESDPHFPYDKKVTVFHLGSMKVQPYYMSPGILQWFVLVSPLRSKNGR